MIPTSSGKHEIGEENGSGNSAGELDRFLESSLAE